MRPTMITPMLILDESGISSYDPQDPTDLSLLWSGTLAILLTLTYRHDRQSLIVSTVAFSKTSHVVEQGERLRNLSWRLWNRERLCCTRNRSLSSSAPTPLTSLTVTSAVPQLSTSVESNSTDSSDEDIPARSSLLHQKERHITPTDLRNMVHSIKQQPRPRPFAQQPRSVPGSHAPESSRPSANPADSEQSSSPRKQEKLESSQSTAATAVTNSFVSISGDSDSSASSNTSSSHSIVRGFTPGAAGTTSYTSKVQMAPPPQPQPQPILKKPCTTVAGLSKKKSNGMFMLGCSSGSGASIEDESVRDSVISRSLRSSGGSQRPAEPKKQTSFKDEVAVMKPNAHEEAAVFDDSEDEDVSDSDVSESAIEEDEDAWEDEGSDSQEPELKKDEEMKFYRVDSAAHLPSRRSALTLNIEGQRSSNGFRSVPTYKRSRTSTPNGPSMPGSPEQDSQLELHARQMGASKPIIPTTTNTQPPQPLTSPRTTRRNMMAGELSESLRKNMLSERQQRNPLQIDAALIRRANTASDVSRLGRLPEGQETQAPAQQPGRPISNWDQYFDQHTAEFHEAGW